MDKSKILINMEGGFLFCGGWNFSKSVSVDSTFIREVRVSEFKIDLATLCYVNGTPKFGGYHQAPGRTLEVL